MDDMVRAIVDDGYAVREMVSFELQCLLGDKLLHSKSAMRLTSNLSCGLDV